MKDRTSVHNIAACLGHPHSLHVACPTFVVCLKLCSSPMHRVPVTAVAYNYLSAPDDSIALRLLAIIYLYILDIRRIRRWIRRAGRHVSNDRRHDGSGRSGQRPPLVGRSALRPPLGVPSPTKKLSVRWWQS